MNMEVGRFVTGASGRERKEKVAANLEALAGHPLVDMARPTLLGEGGNHVVFTLAEGHGVVVKVQREYLLDSFDYAEEMMGHASEPEIAKRQLRVLQKRLRQEQGNSDTVAKYFPGQTLVENISIMPVPFTPELLQTLARPDRPAPELPSGQYELPTIVTVQEQAPDAAFGPESYGVQMRYIESQPEFLDGSAVDSYTDLNALWLDGADSSDAPQLGLSDMVKHQEDLEFFALAKRDQAVHDTCVKFVTAAMQLSRETGNLLDFIGANNVRAFPQTTGSVEAWRLLMIDGRLAGGMFAHGRGIVNRMIDHKPDISIAEVGIAMLALNYTRFINAWAADLGLSDRLKFLDQPVAPHSQTILNAIAKSYRGEEFSVRSVSDQEKLPSQIAAK